MPRSQRNRSRPYIFPSYLPGVNQSFYYGITTTLGDGTEVFDLDANASSLAEPVLEQTTPIRTPYNIVSSFDPETSQTTVQWINYNDIVPILPESGDDAYRIQLYRTSSPVSRANTSILNNFQTENWELPAGTSQYVLDIPPNTDREVYYSLNYLLPNWTDGTTDYEDLRCRTMQCRRLREDNNPPSPVFLNSATFTPSVFDGRGTTRLVGPTSLELEGESYRIYMSDSSFSSILRSDVQLIATVDENKEEFDYEIPIGRLGYAFYCVVIVDAFGTFDANISEYSCWIAS